VNSFTVETSGSLRRARHAKWYTKTHYCFYVVGFSLPSVIGESHNFMEVMSGVEGCLSPLIPDGMTMSVL
jgi:hypothetical protein